MKRVRPFPFDRLERIARAQVEAGRTLRAELPLWPGQLAPEIAARLGVPVEVSLVESYAFPTRELALRLPGDGARLLCRLGAPAGRAALLAIEPRLASWAARRALGRGTDGAAPLDDAERGALVQLIAAAVAPLRAEGFLADAAQAAALFPDPSVLAVEARVRAGEREGWARLLVPERLRLRVASGRSRDTLMARRDRVGAARAELRLEIGRTRLAPSELAGLEEGDTVMFEEFGPRPPLGGPLLLRLGHGVIRAHLDGEGLTILKGFELGAQSMAASEERLSTSDKGAADDGSTDALLRELPVEVICELGRVTMSGRELVELRPGAVIPIGRPLAGPVDLTVGGRVVGRGELVDVEGEIGVRITQLTD